MRRHIDRLEGAHYERGYVYNTHYHLIWVTKYRRRVFTTPELIKDIKDLLLEVAGSYEIQVEAVEVMPDHVHMMVSFKPKRSATDVVKTLKGRSARFFFEKHPDLKGQMFWGGHLWSNSYYIGTTGKMSSDTVKRYIENQYVKAAEEKTPKTPDSSRD